MPSAGSFAIECLFSPSLTDTDRKELLFLCFLVDNRSSWVSTCCKLKKKKKTLKTKNKKPPLKKTFGSDLQLSMFSDFILCGLDWFMNQSSSPRSRKRNLSAPLWAGLWCTSLKEKLPSSSNQHNPHCCLERPLVHKHNSCLPQHSMENKPFSHLSAPLHWYGLWH